MAAEGIAAEDDRECNRYETQAPSLSEVRAFGDDDRGPPRRKT